jgi:UDP-glucose 4-epimerase
MKVLVTGGGGFTGMVVVNRLLARGDAVIVFDIGVSAPLQALIDTGADVTAVVGDITSLPHIAQTFKQHRPDAVVHLAAAVGAGPTMGNPWRVVEVNVGGTLHLMETMRLYDIKRMIFLSTEETWGDMNLVNTETDYQVPFLPYGISKLTVEHFCNTYNRLHGLECIGLRTSWIYSPGLPRPRPPNTFIDAALEGRSFHMTEGAETVVDFTHMYDVVQGILRALDHPKHPHHVYNVGSGVATSFQEVVDIVKELVPGADISTAPGPYHFPGGVQMPKKGALDNTRARETFGYEPEFPDIRRGLENYIEQVRQEGSP